MACRQGGYNFLIKNIQILDIQAANQIAAGEVVDRPVSVVKELIENSLDAGATKLEVIIEGSGVELIRVHDNGEGIPAQELSLSVLRHATSKIRSIKDLNTLGTLGFRGEALPSIASVSKMEIISRPPTEVSGTLLALEGGKEIEFTDTGCPPGTTVTVRDLFYNTPARRKFLKSKNREFGLISECIGRLALARPDVSFTLRHPQAIVLQTPGRGQLLDSVGAVLGHNTARRLIEVSHQQREWELTGFISPPDLVRSSRQSEYLIVNGRIIRSSVISRAILEGYHTLIPPKFYPITILSLKMPPDQYDVNVHPTKMEIRFHQEKELSEFIAEGIRQILLGSHPITTFSPKESLARQDNLGTKEINPLKGENPSKEENTSKEINLSKGINHQKELSPQKLPWGLAGIRTQGSQSSQVFNGYLENQGAQTSQGMLSSQSTRGSQGSFEFLSTNQKEEKTGYEEDNGNIENILPRKIEYHKPQVYNGKNNEQDYTSDLDNHVNPSVCEVTSGKIYDGKSEEESVGESAGENILPLEFSFEIEGENSLLRLHPIGQVFKTYILASDGENLVIIDQHAAHERINYENLLLEHQKKPGDSQMLLIPTPIELSPGEEEALLEYMLILNEMGFILEHFGTRTYLLRGIPAYSGPYAGETLLREFLEQVLGNQIPPSMEELLEEWIYLLACKDSIKAKDNLTPLEMEQLIFQLSKTTNPYTCPHGRPTMIQLTQKELERRFYRS